MGQSYGTITLRSGEYLSEAFDLDGGVLGGFVLTNGWTSASITFQVSVDDNTYYDLYFSGSTESTLNNPTAGVFLHVPDNNWPNSNRWGFRWIKVRSGSSSSPIGQEANRIILVTSRRV